MAINSQTQQIFKAEDPVFATDLDLLAKVNEFQEQEFQKGSQQFQQSVNNWSLVTNQAKGIDRDYAISKLNGIMNQIHLMGGINLADQNNVNSLESLGYNVYGDENIMRPLETTRRLQALQQNIATNTQGKNGKDYDSVYGEWLMHSYDAWLNDGKQGTGYEGPISLPEGTFDQYGTKIREAISKLPPDAYSTPEEVQQNGAFNYYQIGDKYIKKDRIGATIDAVTTDQDRQLISAHAWKSMGSMPDSYLLGLQGKNYDSDISQLQDERNDVNYQLSLNPSDFKQKLALQGQAKQLTDAINSITEQKNSLPKLNQGQQLDEEYRQNLRDNLFYSAFKDDNENAFSYQQTKIELKSNEGNIAAARLAQSGKEWGLDYDLHVDQYTLQKDKFDWEKQKDLYGLYGMSTSSGFNNLGLNGPGAHAPLSIVPNLGKDDATLLNGNIVNNADANLLAAQNKWQSLGYNVLATKPEFSKYFKKDPNTGDWLPLDYNSKKIINDALEKKMTDLGNIASKPMSARDGNYSDDDQKLFESYQDVMQAMLYKQNMEALQEQVFRNAGLTPPSQKTITISTNDGKSVTMTYDKVKEMQERGEGDPDYKILKDKASDMSLFQAIEKEESDLRDSIFKTRWDHADPSKNDEFNAGAKKILDKYESIGKGGALQLNSLDNVFNVVDSYYNSSGLDASWQKASKDFNVYSMNVNMPKLKDGKIPQYLSTLQTTLGDALRSKEGQSSGMSEYTSGNFQDKDLEVIKVFTTYKADSTDGNPLRYMAVVKYPNKTKVNGVEKTIDNFSTVDVTNEVMGEKNGDWLRSQYADDNSQMVYGMMISNTGSTPFNKDDGYAHSEKTNTIGYVHNYQIIAIKNKDNGIDSYRVNIAIPTGGGNYTVIPVKYHDNGDTTSFPPNEKVVESYMNEMFSSDTNVKYFYQLHGIPYPDPTKQ